MKLGFHHLFTYVGRALLEAKKAFTGATATAAGTAGAVPIPNAGDNLKFLTGGAGWKHESFRGPHAPANAYTAGTFCVANGLLAYCNADIPANTPFSWGGNGQTWQPQLDGNAVFQGVYNATTVYGVGGVVAVSSGQGLLYKSIAANNVGKAVTDLGFWIPYTVSLDASGLVTALSGGTPKASTILSKMLLETTQVFSTVIAASPTLALELLNGLVILHTVAPTSTWALNIIGSSTATLNATMAIGQCVTFTHLIQMGTTAYMPTGISIDGQVKTELWTSGVKPAAGVASCLNCYSYTIIKTADQSFLVLADQSTFK